MPRNTIEIDGIEYPCEIAYEYLAGDRGSKEPKTEQVLEPSGVSIYSIWAWEPNVQHLHPPLPKIDILPILTPEHISIIAQEIQEEIES